MKKRVDVYLILLFIWFTLDLTGLTVTNFNLVRGTGFFGVNGIWWGSFLIILLLYFLFDRRGQYIMIAFLSFWSIVQYFNHWHFSIFGDKNLLEKKVETTIQLIPQTQNIILPDLYGLILDSLIIISLVLLSMYMLKNRNKKYMEFNTIIEDIETQEIIKEVIS